MRLIIEPVRNADWIDTVLQRVQSGQLVKRTLQLNSLQVQLDMPAAPNVSRLMRKH